jgi:hypothetical protein
MECSEWAWSNPSASREDRRDRKPSATTSLLLDLSAAGRLSWRRSERVGVKKDLDLASGLGLVSEKKFVRSFADARTRKLDDLKLSDLIASIVSTFRRLERARLGPILRRVSAELGLRSEREKSHNEKDDATNRKESAHDSDCLSLVASTHSTKNNFTLRLLSTPLSIFIHLRFSGAAV